MFTLSLGVPLMAGVTSRVILKYDAADLTLEGAFLAGLIAGLAGIVYASRIATATSTVGVGAELQAITAVILGGASLSGGKGTIWGALIGVFFMALMKNVLIISRVSSEWQGIILGAVLVLAVALDSIMNRKKS